MDKNHFLNQATDMLKDDEGFRARLYKCPAGKQTIGFGFNVDDTPITYEQASFILETQVRDYDMELNDALSCYIFLSEPRKIVLLNMRHALGMVGLLKFRKMLEALTDQDYTNAAVEIRDSDFWRSETRNRAERLAVIMETDNLI